MAEMMAEMMAEDWPEGDSGTWWWACTVSHASLHTVVTREVGAPRGNKPALQGEDAHSRREGQGQARTNCKARTLGLVKQAVKLQ